jgi:hypothetical protein
MEKYVGIMKTAAINSKPPLSTERADLVGCRHSAHDGRNVIMFPRPT